MKRNRSAGFTLIEIVVVLAVLALLATFFMAILLRAQGNGRRTVCLGNLKQLSLALQQYVQDNDGRFPMAHLAFESLFPYVKSEKSFRCPSLSRENGMPFDYAITPWLWEVDYRGQKVYGSRHEATVATTTTTIAVYEDTGNKDRETIENTCGVTEVGMTHFNGANYAFVDGHVAWLTSLQFARLGCLNSWDGSGP